MLVRDEVLAIPDKPSYFSVELEGRDVHHFRVPPLSVQFQIVTLAYTSSTHLGEASPAAFVDAACAAVGASWKNRTKELEAVFQPGCDAEGIRAFSREVQLELIDEGYRITEILALGGKVIEVYQERIGDSHEASAVADFTGPQPDKSPSP